MGVGGSGFKGRNAMEVVRGEGQKLRDEFYDKFFRAFST